MSFYAPGKLMISGEYVVLDGALALAIPTAGYGQNLQVDKHPADNHRWESYDVNGKWFEAVFSKDLNQIITTSNKPQAVIIQQLLQFIKRQKPQLFQHSKYFKTNLNFNRFWGLGSSSSLIALLAKWSGVSAFDLLNISFGGSGYDVAVAMQNQAILYHLSGRKQSGAPVYREQYPVWQVVNFQPVFAKNLFLIYLNIKQNSRKEIQNYQYKKVTPAQVKTISKISQDILQCQSLEGFERLIDQHEQIISRILKRPMVQQAFFDDYPGQIKSLGAWGGDFIMATRQEAPDYFRSKGYHQIICLKDILG